MIELVIGIGIVLFLLLYAAFNLDPEHIAFKFLIFAIVIHLMMFIPKVMMTSSCDVEINSTEINGNVTHYTYDTVCQEEQDNTASLFFKLYVWIVRFFWGYVLIYTLWVLWIKTLVERLGWIKKTK